MENTQKSLIANSLGHRKDAVFFEASQGLAQSFPNMSLVETEESSFKLLHFAWAGKCEAIPKEGVHSQMAAEHNQANHSLWIDPTNAWYDVSWTGHKLQVLTIGVQGFNCRVERHFVLAETMSIAKGFVLACCEWNSEVRAEVLVFSGGWYKDADLYESIQATTLDSLVLEGSLKQEIEADFRSFFDSREVYREHGIPWKRGVILLGAPGNGKTHAIKGLVNVLGKPCLYVRTFKRQYTTDQQMIREVFKRARSAAPCLLIFEDLDSIVDDGNRSYFLNELDGFASNEGILTVATTNYPERLDPAILDRPSRFDRKYTFHLPDEETRVRYLNLLNSTLQPKLKLSTGEVLRLAQRTNDFTYAYLKELVLSSMMKWIAEGGSSSMASAMESQLDSLKAQMYTSVPDPKPEPGVAPHMARWLRGK